MRTKWKLLVIAIVGLAFSACASESHQLEHSSPPNIIYILADEKTSDTINPTVGESDSDRADPYRGHRLRRVRPSGSSGRAVRCGAGLLAIVFFV